MKEYNDYLISIVLIFLAVLFLDPFMYWMPHPLVFGALGALLVVFAVFVLFVWREQVRDEREELHRMIAGRVGYTAGASLLVLGIIYQTLTSTPNPWLVFALVGMILGKLFGRMYGERIR